MGAPTRDRTEFSFLFPFAVSSVASALYEVRRVPLGGSLTFVRDDRWGSFEMTGGNRSG